MSYKHLIIFLSILCLGTAHSKSINYHLKRLSTDEGLSQQDVGCLIQDQLGRIWIGTYDGLNRYNGTSIKIFRKNTLSNNSLIDNRVTALERWDSRNEIWIGTEGLGVCCFNIKTEKFSIPYDTINNDDVKVLHQYDNILWIGGRTLLKSLSFDETGNPHIISYSLAIATGTNWFVTAIVHDNNGNIILGTTHGLYIKTVHSDTFQLVDKRYILGLLLDSVGNLWINTWSEILFYPKDSQKTVDYLHHPTVISLPNDISAPILSIKNIYENSYLINTSSDIYRMQKSGNDIVFNKILFSNNEFFQNNPIRSIFIDNTMNVWINSSREGVGIFDLNQKDIYRLTLTNKQSDNRISVQAITKDHKGQIWIGTNQGLFISKRHDTPKCIQISNEEIYGILCDCYMNIWCTTGQDIICYRQGNEYKKEILSSIKGLSDSLTLHEGPYSICEDPDRKIIWIGLRTGILELRNYHSPQLSFRLYNTKNLKTLNASNLTNLLFLKERNTLLITSSNAGVFESKLDNNGSIVSITPILYESDNNMNEHIWCIFKASTNQIYIGTDSGLRQLKLQKGEFIIEKIPHDHLGLQTYKITAICEDTQHNLWLNTGQGLISYNLETESINHYTNADGLASSILTEGIYFDAESNQLYIGGYKGLNVVNLNHMYINEIPPKTIIESIRINNQEIHTGEVYNQRVILPANINFTPKIELQHDENNISLDLASLHYTAPNKNQFIFSIEKEQPEWTALKGNTITITNLSVGKHTLMIKSANGDDVWETQPLKLEILVHPAPWLSWWAYTLYAIISCLIIFFVYRYYTNKKKAQHQQFILQLEQEKKLEIAEIKLKYHTNITHEIRTPLSLILAPVQELIDKNYPDNYLNARLYNIRNNTNRLLQLVGQFLDLRKIISNKYNLQVSYQRIDNKILLIKKNFEQLAIHNRISLNLYYDTNLNYCWCDIEVINKICYNLISNALKYTSTNGSVNIFVSSDLNMKSLTISIEDTGEGIEEDELKNIFERFYQVPNNKGGTGIGLHLCKYLVNLHHGTITVTSRKGEGSIFTVTIPVDKESFTDDEIIDNISAPQEDLELKKDEEAIDSSQAERITVLIVEDNVELREYLASSLIETYDVITAENGEVGYKNAIARIPDIIISDIMMPVMDGVDFLNLIKSNVLTCHIPFIFLTAKDNIQDEIEGLSNGADDYITKPFNISTLKLKIRNLVKLSSATSQNDSKSESEFTKRNNLNERDAKFIEELQQIIYDNLQTPDFGIEDLCRIMCISRMQLHRKTTAILSKKPSQIIKEIRMKRAYELISVKGYNITETMQEVGYTNHSYFAKLFIEVNGISPKDAMRINKQ